MNLYRIDLTDSQGCYVGMVCDILGVALYRTRKRANSEAIAAAQDADTFAHIIRISGPGHVRRVGIVSPGSSTVGRTNDDHVPSIR